MMLTYDALLEPHAMWSMSADPFDVSALSKEQIDEREKQFVDAVAQRSTETPHDWLTYSMLRRRDGDT